MPLLNTASKVYVGSAEAVKVYQGSNLVWEAEPTEPGGYPQHSIWGTSALPFSSTHISDEGTIMEVGQVFYRYTPISGTYYPSMRIAGVKIWNPTGITLPGGNITVRVYTNTTRVFNMASTGFGTLVATKTAATSTVSTDGWNTIPFDTPVPMPVDYGSVVATYHFDDSPSTYLLEKDVRTYEDTYSALDGTTLAWGSHRGDEYGIVFKSDGTYYAPPSSSKSSYGIDLVVDEGGAPVTIPSYPQHSIWGSNAFTGTLSRYNDGGDITLGKVFYKFTPNYGTLYQNMRVVGAKFWLPSGHTMPSGTVTFKAHTNPGALTDFGTYGWGTLVAKKTVPTATFTVGWNTVLFDSPAPMPQDGGAVVISYHFDDEPWVYFHAPSARSTFNLPALDGTNVVWAEGPNDYHGSVFILGMTNYQASLTGDVSYGIDIVVDEGQINVTVAPDALSGLLGWWDARTLTAGTVSSWPSTTGSYTASQITPANNPERITYLGSSAVTFNGSAAQHGLDIVGLGTALQGLTDYSVLIRVIVDNAHQGPVLLVAPNNAAYQFIIEQLNPIDRLAWGHATGNFNEYAATGGTATLPPSWRTVQFIKSSTSVKVYYENNSGTVIATGGSGVTPSDAIPSAVGTTVRVGMYYNEGLRLSGYISDIAIYNRALTDAERMSVVQYLWAKDPS